MLKKIKSKFKDSGSTYLLNGLLIFGWPGGMVIGMLLIGVDDQLATYYLFFSGFCFIFLLVGAYVWDQNPDAGIGEPLIYALIIAALLFGFARGCAPMSTDEYDPSNYHLRP